MIRLDRFDKKSVNYSTNRTVSGYKDSILGIIPDDWEVRKLKEVSKRVQRRNDCKPYEVLTISSIGGFLNQTERFSKVIAGKNIAKYILLKKNEFAYNKGNSKTYPFGCIFRLEDYEKALVPNVYYCFEIVNGISEFYKHYFIAGKLNRQLSRVINTGVRNDGLLNLNVGDFFDAYVPAPPLEEQKKIATILSNWDKAIELKEKLIEQKKELKKGLMQKLLTGEMRLPGFGLDWKEVRLGSILKERKETGYDHLELLAITSRNGVVRRTEVDIKDNSSENKSKYKRILPNDIGYNTMRMWQGVSGVSKYEGIVSPAYTILKPTEKVSSDFIGHLFKLPKVINLFKRYSQGLVNDTLNLKYENLKVIKVFIPTDIREQKSIAEILECIDKEINTLQREVELLKEQKKGLMQLLLTGKVRVQV